MRGDERSIAPPTEVGTLGLYHLKRLWSAFIAERSGSPIGRTGEQAYDRLIINALGLGLHQTVQYLFQVGPSFAEFEDWIAFTAGKPDPLTVDRVNAEIAGEEIPRLIQNRLDSVALAENVLTQADLTFWSENGYMILRQAIEEDARSAAERNIWEHVEAEPAAPDSWYGGSRPGIMVEFIQHPALERNRRSERIHKAFAQLWGTADLWVTSDRCGFFPPQKEGFPFPGPDLHWDVDFRSHVGFGTQGILYLTDTPAEQGAFMLVPGFHKKLTTWLETLEPGADPQRQDLHALGSVPIAAKGGDMVIWDQRLPHGPSPNLGTRPRIVQYINMYPGPRHGAQ